MGREKKGERWNKEPAYPTLTVHLQIQCVLNLAFANAKGISLVMLNVGRGAKIREVEGQVVRIRMQKREQGLRIKKQEETRKNWKEERRQVMKENRGPALLMQIVQRLTLFVLNMAFANVKVTSREIQSAGRGAKAEEEKKEQGVDKVAAHQTLIVHPPIRSVRSLDSANVQHTSQVIPSAGVHRQKQEEKQKEEEAAPQMPIVQLRTQSALNLVSASVSATSLEMQSAGARETPYAAAVRLEKETQAANRTLIVLPLTPSALSLASASAAAMRREMRSAGGEETLCAADRGASRMLGWGIFLH